MYNDLSVVIRPTVYALIALFLYTLWLSGSLFSKSGENNSNFLYMQINISGKSNKISSSATKEVHKIHAYLVLTK